MLKTSSKIRNDILKKYSARMTRKQKKRFRSYLLENFQNVKVEKSLFANNVIIGDIEKAEKIIGAHYDTPPRMPSFIIKNMIFWCLIGLPLTIQGFLHGGLFVLLHYRESFAQPIFEGFLTGFIFLYYALLFFFVFHVFGITPFFNKTNHNDNSSGVLVLLEAILEDVELKNAYVFFDNEEKGLLGSIMFKMRHRKKIKNKQIIILDCVGQGNEVNLYHCRKKQTEIAKKTSAFLKEKSIPFRFKKSNIMSMSDHVPFRKMNHVLLLTNFSKKERKNSLATIHCKKDNKIDFENIDLLKGAILNG